MGKGSGGTRKTNIYTVNNTVSKKISESANRNEVRMYSFNGEEARLFIEDFYNTPPRERVNGKFVMSIGRADSDLVNYADRNNIFLASDEEFMDYNSLSHTRRASKVEAGIAPSIEDVANFPKNRHSMSLYYDTSKNNFVYNDGVNKWIVEPNGEHKKIKGQPNRCLYITGSKISDEEFSEFRSPNGKYRRIR